MTIADMVLFGLCFAVIGLLFNTCCCGGCHIFSDSFGSDNLATNYTTESGMFAVGSGVLTTTDDGAILVCNTASPTGHGRMEVQVRWSSASAIVRLYGAWVDANNHLWAEISATSSTNADVRLWSRAAGVDTQLGITLATGLDINQDWPVTLSWDGRLGSFRVDGVTHIVAGLYAGAGTKVALGGDASGGTLTFDNLAFERHNVDNSTCDHLEPCRLLPCTANTFTPQIQVEIANVVNDGCLNCANYNTAFLLDFSDQAADCHWKLTDLGLCGVDESLHIHFNESVDPSFRFNGGAVCGAFSFEGDEGIGTLSVSVPADCTDPRSLSITDTSVACGHCDWSSATITATPVT